MKKLILVSIAVMLFFATVKAQAPLKSSFNYAIPILTDTVLRSGDVKVVHQVASYPPRFVDGMVIFYFDIASYNITDPDTSIFVGRQRQVEGVLYEKEQNAIVQNRRVYEWLASLTSKTPIASDSIVIKLLAKKVYNYKILGSD